MNSGAVVGTAYSMGKIMSWLFGSPSDNASDRIKEASRAHEAVARRAVIQSTRSAVSQDHQREVLEELLDEMERRKKHDLEAHP